MPYIAAPKDPALPAEVEAFLERHSMPATKFGRLAAGDPRFVLDMRICRIPRASTGARIRAWMNDYETGVAA